MNITVVIKLKYDFAWDSIYQRRSLIDVLIHLYMLSSYVASITCDAK